MSLPNLPLRKWQMQWEKSLFNCRDIIMEGFR